MWRVEPKKEAKRLVMAHMPELEWFHLLIGSTPQVLDRLAVELNAFSRPRDGGSYVYRRSAPAKGDPEWLDKLQKAQDSVARPAVAAALFKELFPRAERLQTSCEKMLKMSKGQPASMDGALRLSVEGLKSLVEFTPNRRSSEATGRRAHQDCHYDESA